MIYQVLYVGVVLYGGIKEKPQVSLERSLRL